MKFIITTTNSLEGYKLEKYLGIVSTSVVAGTGLFSDVLAGFSDVFGGRSESYRKQLNSIKNEVLGNLEKEAKLVGANGVLGLKIDFDEISGKGKTMLMVSATGTAVKLQTPLKDNDSKIEDDIFLGEDLEFIIQKDQIIRNIKKNSGVLSDNEWSFIISNRIIEVLEILADKFNESFEGKNPVQDYRDKKEYLNMKDYLLVISTTNNAEKIYKLLTINNRHLNNLCINALSETGNIHLDLIIDVFVRNKLKPKYLPKLVMCNPLIYSPEDIPRLQELNNYLKDRYPMTSESIEKKGVLSSKSSTYWECENGHKCLDETIYCKQCHVDRYGYKHGQINPGQAIAVLTKKIEMLEKHFKLK